MIKPRTPTGVMELLPADQMAFQRMLDTIRRNYERFGFSPIETPVFELTETLLTKSGGETERQVYFVQSTGNLEKKSDALPELAMRFDLTVPLARYVAEHERELAFPFRRYQMQRVYRGERAQRGRFREFYQCDIDVIGKDALSVRYDAEIPAVIYAIFNDLAIGPFTIQLNNRKILKGFFESLALAEGSQQELILREIDKIDKRGADAVKETLLADPFNLDASKAEELMRFVGFRSSSTADALNALEALKGRNETLDEGVNEMTSVINALTAMNIPQDAFALNFSIARGLDYYTGTVYETTLNDYPQIGSICSGGRYENLASHYTKSKLPGVGISIGLTRLFFQLKDAGLISTEESTTQVLVVTMEDSEDALEAALQFATSLRQSGINTEVMLENAKLAKQFKYADKARIGWVAVIGEDERTNNQVTLKNLSTQQQVTINQADAATHMHQH